MNEGMLFVLAIIVVVSIASIAKTIVRHRLGIPQSSGRGDRRETTHFLRDNGETAKLKDEVQALKQRIQTLERIAVEKENSLSREIENLRDR